MGFILNKKIKMLQIRARPSLFTILPHWLETAKALHVACILNTFVNPVFMYRYISKDTILRVCFSGPRNHIFLHLLSQSLLLWYCLIFQHLYTPCIIKPRLLPHHSLPNSQQPRVQTCAYPFVAPT